MKMAVVLVLVEVMVFAHVDSGDGGGEQWGPWLKALWWLVVGGCVVSRLVMESGGQPCMVMEVVEMVMVMVAHRGGVVSLSLSWGCGRGRGGRGHGHGGHVVVVVGGGRMLWRGWLSVIKMKIKKWQCTMYMLSLPILCRDVVVALSNGSGPLLFVVVL